MVVAAREQRHSAAPDEPLGSSWAAGEGDMTTIATTGLPAQTSMASVSRGAIPAASTAAGQAAAGGSDDAGGDATTVQISDLARMLAQSFAPQSGSAADQAGQLKLPANFDEMVTQRTDTLAATLTDAFAAAHIPLADATTLVVDSYGQIRADGPGKKKIEQYFKDNPEAAKEFKTVATLNSLKAAEQVLRLYNEEKKAATTDDQKAAAFDRWTARMVNIQSLSGIMSLQGGKLISATGLYADSITPPGSDAKSAQSPGVDLVA
jgi:hypothetical protein